jgi:plasmid stabilization system protein ParE
VSVRFTPRAFRELKDIYAYLQDRSPQGATSVMARLEDLVAALAAQPKIGVHAGSRGLRRATAQPYPYFVFYRATASGVVVHGVRHAARNPKSMPGGGV